MKNQILPHRNSLRTINNCKRFEVFRLQPRYMHVANASSTMSTSDLLESIMKDRINALLRLIIKSQTQHCNPRRHENEKEIVCATSPKSKPSIFNKIRHYIHTLLNAIFVALRSLEIAIRFSPILLMGPAAALLDNSHVYTPTASSSLASRGNTKISDLAWIYTLYQIQSLGPAFIKISQWAATRQDVFPRHMCDRLSQLHDSAYIHKWEHSESLLVGAFGKDYGNWLRIFKNDVIGSGSVAQVYRGSIHKDGSEKTVAVKVLHPNINEKIEKDLNLMWRVASLLDALPSKTIKLMNLPTVVSNFADLMRHQIDLRNESYHLEEFRRNFRNVSGFDYDDKNHTAESLVPLISFPRPIAAERSCLVEDYEDGMPISHYVSDDSAEGMELRRQLAQPLLRSFLKMVFMDNFIHSDLHQGNIIVKKTRIYTQSCSLFDDFFPAICSDEIADKYTIVFLDAGIVTSLSRSDQQNLKDLFKAVVLNDGDKAGRLMVERAKYETCSNIDGGTDQFAQGMSKIVQEFHNRRDRGLTLGAVQIASLISRVMDLCRDYGVQIDPAMSNVVMSTLVLEGEWYMEYCVNYGTAVKQSF